jgi:hypothetical protein
MAQVVQRTWRSGQRKVRKSAWGYTLQVDGKHERKYNAAWTKDDAQAALVVAHRMTTIIAIIIAGWRSYRRSTFWPSQPRRHSLAARYLE